MIPSPPMMLLALRVTVAQYWGVGVSTNAQVLLSPSTKRKHCSISWGPLRGRVQQFAHIPANSFVWDSVSHETRAPGIQRVSDVYVRVWCILVGRKSGDWVWRYWRVGSWKHANEPLYTHVYIHLYLLICKLGWKLTRTLTNKEGWHERRWGVYMGDLVLVLTTLPHLYPVCAQQSR